MAIFKTGGNFKSNTGHFYINFEYKTHLNFGGKFSKKKVRLIVRKIRYVHIILFFCLLGLLVIYLCFIYSTYLKTTGKECALSMLLILQESVLKVVIRCSLPVNQISACTGWIVHDVFLQYN